MPKVGGRYTRRRGQQCLRDGDQRGPQTDVSSHLPQPRPRRSAAAALAACGGGTTHPARRRRRRRRRQRSGAGAATYWFLTGQPQEGIRDEHRQAVQRRRTPTARSSTTKFQNDAYKTKIKTAIGAGQGPTIIWGWGGGGLREYVKNDQVEDLTSFFSENAALKDKLFPAAFGAATVDGKIYAMPAETVQPIVLLLGTSGPSRRSARSLRSRGATS